MKILIHITKLLDSINNSDSSINKRMLRIIFKIKKYCMIYIQNERSLEFDMSEIIVKNILIYKIFDKEN